MSNKKKAADYFKEKPKASYPHSMVVDREPLFEPEQLEYSSVPVRGVQEQYADQSRMQQLQMGVPATAPVYQQTPQAATPVQQERSAPMNANEDVLSRISAINAANGFGGGTPSINGYRAPDQVVNGVPALMAPVVEYPWGPTIEVTEMLGVEEPQNGGPDQGGYANKVRLPENPNAWAGAPGGTVVRDSFGNAVLSGTGQPIGLPTQNPNYKAPAGGGKGADANVDSAIKQIGGK